MTISTDRMKLGKTASHLLYKSTAITLITVASLLPVPYADALDNSDETFTLNLQNVGIRSLIQTVSIRTGKNFIVDPRVKANVNIVSSEPVNTDRLYQLFLSVLEVHGYAAVQVGEFTKIVPSSVGVQSPVPILTEQPDTRDASGDELVTRVIHLGSASSLQVAEALRPLLPASASVTAESNSNAVIVTDRAANIEKLIELIILMDGQ